MDDSRVMVLGTATRYFDQITDLDQPFYDFFRVFDLRPLTLEEMKTSLLALAEARGEKNMVSDIPCRRKDGSIFPAHMSCSVLRDRSGHNADTMRATLSHLKAEAERTRS